jgi:cyclohexanecarboxylate-CoA ligase
LMFGAPTFLQDLMRLPELEPGTFPSLHMICTPGAPIPRKLIPRARETLGCFICPAWGMTEWGIGISGSPRLPQDRTHRGLRSSGYGNTGQAGGAGAGGGAAD